MNELLLPKVSQKIYHWHTVWFYRQPKYDTTTRFEIDITMQHIQLKIQKVDRKNTEAFRFSVCFFLHGFLITGFSVSEPPYWWPFLGGCHCPVVLTVGDRSVGHWQQPPCCQAAWEQTGPGSVWPCGRTRYGRLHSSSRIGWGWDRPMTCQGGDSWWRCRAWAQCGPAKYYIIRFDLL